MPRPRAGDGRQIRVPDNITADQLDPEATAELRTLPGDLAEVVARYLVATAREDDPEVAYQYAAAARGLAARVGIVRETAAIAAYQAGKWADALAEFRAARRLTGRDTYLPLMADSERALGRIDRALDIVTGPDARGADRPTQVELRIVESGIRRDQGLADAAVVALQIPELTEKRAKVPRARLFYAYADALLDAGREDEARNWFGKAATADVNDETDAADRVDELDGMDDFTVEDLDDWEDAVPDDVVLEEDSLLASGEVAAIEDDESLDEDLAGQPDARLAADCPDDDAGHAGPAAADAGSAASHAGPAAADAGSAVSQDGPAASDGGAAAGESGDEPDAADGRP